MRMRLKSPLQDQVEPFNSPSSFILFSDLQKSHTGSSGHTVTALHRGIKSCCKVPRHFTMRHYFMHNFTHQWHSHQHSAFFSHMQKALNHPLHASALGYSGRQSNSVCKVRSERHKVKPFSSLSQYSASFSWKP